MEKACSSMRIFSIVLSETSKAAVLREPVPTETDFNEGKSEREREEEKKLVKMKDGSLVNAFFPTEMEESKSTLLNSMEDNISNPLSSNAIEDSLGASTYETGRKEGLEKVKRETE